MSESNLIVPGDDPQLDKILTEFSMFNPDSQMALAMSANMDDGGLEISDMPKVAFPAAGGTTWEYSTVSGEHNTKTLRGIIVFRQRYGLLWPTNKNENGEKSKPVLETTDMKTAVLRGEVTRHEETGRIISIAGTNSHTPAGLVDDISEKEIFVDGQPTGKWKWNELAFTQFGTAVNGSGKYAAERMLLLILLPDSHVPVALSVPPGSLKIAKNFILQLSAPYWRCVVDLGLVKITEKADPFSQLVPKLVSIVPESCCQTVDQFHEQMQSAYGNSVESLIDDSE